MCRDAGGSFSPVEGNMPLNTHCRLPPGIWLMTVRTGRCTGWTFDLIQQVFPYVLRCLNLSPDYACPKTAFPPVYFLARFCTKKRGQKGGVMDGEVQLPLLLLCFKTPLINWHGQPFNTRDVVLPSHLLGPFTFSLRLSFNNNKMCRKNTKTCLTHVLIGLVAPVHSTLTCQHSVLISDVLTSHKRVPCMFKYSCFLTQLLTLTCW